MNFARRFSSSAWMCAKRSKCILVLLYGLDACPINATNVKMLPHPIANIFMKMFATKSAEVVTECQQAFGFQPIRNQINCLKIKFLNRYVTCPIVAYVPLLVINALQMRYSIQWPYGLMFEYISSAANKLSVRL